MRPSEDQYRASSSCREEVLAAAVAIVAAKGKNWFSVQEIIDYLGSAGTRYEESTIATHIVSRCCVNAPKHHAVTYDYFERVGRGLYRIIETI